VQKPGPVSPVPGERTGSQGRADTVIIGSVLPCGIQRGYQHTCPVMLTLWQSTQYRIIYY